jgi:CHAD domain-containing protein
MTSSPDPRQLACACAGALLDSLESQLQRTLKEPNAEQIHDLRVATRRFTQALVIFESYLKDTRKIRRELRTPMTLAGEVRDLDITTKLLGESGVPAAAEMVGRIEKKRLKTQRTLEKATGRIVERGAIRKWRSSLAPGKSKGPAPDHTKDVKKAVERAAERFFDRGERAYAAKDSSAAHSAKSGNVLHRLRIAAKKLRYTLELAAGPNGTRERMHHRIRQLQSDLGDIHDLQSVCAIVSEYRGAATVVDPLKKKQRKKIREFRKVWKDEFGGKKNREGWIRRIAGVADSLLSSGGKGAVKGRVRRGKAIASGSARVQPEATAP